MPKKQNSTTVATKTHLPSAVSEQLLVAPVTELAVYTQLVARSVQVAHQLGKVETPLVPESAISSLTFTLAQWQSPFKAQNDRGTCWAFAGVAALEAAYRRKFGAEIDASEEYAFHLGKASALNRDAQGNVVTPIENNSSLTGAQGSGDIVMKLAEAAIPPESVAPYLATQQALLDIPPTLGYTGGAASLQTQEDVDALEFCEQHIPLLARVNCRYRATDWGSLGSSPSIDALENTLLAGHEVVCDVTSKNGAVGGHALLLIGFDQIRRVFFAKNHWGENAFIEIAYDNDPNWSIDSGWYFKDVADPTFVENEACWLGNWFATWGGQTFRLLLRRSDDFRAPGTATRLGSAYLADGRHDVNGRFLDNGRSVQLFLAPGTGPTEPGTSTGTQIDAWLEYSDLYNAQGRTPQGDVLTLSRFTTRFAALWEQGDGAAWQARHGIDGPTYQETFDELVAQGFRLTSVSGYSEGPDARYNAVWTRHEGPTWQARHDLTADEYQATFDDLLVQGFRLVCVSGYAEQGEARYAAIWEQRQGPDWQARHGLSRQQYQDTFDELTGQGYVLREVSGYRVGIDVQFAAIWEREDGVTFVGRHGLTGSQHQAAFDELVGLGYRMTDVCGYSDTGIARYASVWRREAGGAWQARHGLSAEDYQRTFDELAQQGFRPVTVSGYGDGPYPA